VAVVSSDDYRRGQWRALNDVLGYLNTLEDRIVDKATIYRAVADMRPSVAQPHELGAREAIHWCIFYDSNCPSMCATKCRLASPHPGYGIEHD